MTEARIVIPNQQLAELCRRFQVRSLALFGSVLREDFRPDSDVDVLVEFDSNARIGFMAFSRMERELADLLGCPVDPRQRKVSSRLFEIRCLQIPRRSMRPESSSG